MPLRKGIPRQIKPMFKRDKWKILRGDKVMIVTGKDRGEIGIVSKVIRDTRVPKVIVEGRNLVKKHVKRQGENPGGIVQIEAPLHYSNVMLVDPVTNAAVRSGFKYMEDGTKVRVSRGRNASGSIIPRPEVLKQRRSPRPLIGSKDTAPELVLKQTYFPGDWPSALRQYSTSLPSRSSLCSTGAGVAVGDRWRGPYCWRPGLHLAAASSLWRGFAAYALL
eukprot:jgi/Botrbrau1/12683/Bobra.67_1s0047.1